MGKGSLIELALCGRTTRECNPYEIFSDEDLQKILLLINAEPMDVGGLSERLGIDKESVKGLLSRALKCGLIEEQNGLYRPTFAVFTNKDLKVLDGVLGELKALIVGEVKKWVPKFRDLLGKTLLGRRGLLPDDALYVAVGAMTLDYAGLRILSEEGLLVEAKPMPDGGEYVLAAFEKGSLALRENWMWGHRTRFGKYLFSSHGQLPPGGRRLAFPDLAWLWMDLGVDPTNIMTTMGRLLEALREADLGIGELEARIGIESDHLVALLTMLELLGYVRLHGNIWRISTTVFSADEVKEIESLGERMLKQIAEGIKARMGKLREAYARTTPGRNGIPMEEGFNQLYHVVFEGALGLLMAEGAIPRPPVRPDGGRYSVFVLIQ